MIIEFIKSCASIIRITNHTSVNPSMICNNYSVKTLNDIKSWKLSDNSVKKLHFTIISPDVKILEELIFNFNGSQNSSEIIVKIETSLDYINWNELNYIGDEKVVYKVIKTPIGNKYFNIKTKSMEDIDDTSNLSYAFSVRNYFNNDMEPLYNNLEWKFIKISLDNIPDTELHPLSIINLEININEDIDLDSIDQNILELKAGMFTKPKLFEEYEFIPDLTKNYMKMLEEQNTIPNTIHYIDAKLNTDAISEFPPAEGIGGDLVSIDTVIYS